MSPEYAMNGVMSGKTKVYNFHVLLLEIISGMKNNTCIQSNHSFNLIVEATTIKPKFLCIYHNPPTLDWSYYSASIKFKLKCMFCHWTILFWKPYRNSPLWLRALFVPHQKQNLKLNEISHSHADLACIIILTEIVRQRKFDTHCVDNDNSNWTTAEYVWQRGGPTQKGEWRRGWPEWG